MFVVLVLPSLLVASLAYVLLLIVMCACDRYVCMCMCVVVCACACDHYVCMCMCTCSLYVYVCIVRKQSKVISGRPSCDPLPLLLALLHANLLLVRIASHCCLSRSLIPCMCVCDVSV